MDQSAPERVKTRSKVATALSAAGFSDVYVISPEVAEDILTARRRKIIQALASETFQSQRELARYLEMDPGNIKRDLALLIDHGIVAREDAGQGKRPYLKHDTVIVEPLVSPTV